MKHARRDDKFGNARFVRNIFEKSLGLQSSRLARLNSKLAKADLMTLAAQDIPCEQETGFDPLTIDFKPSLWVAECPGCHKSLKGGLKYLAQEVACKCGSRFQYPWWSLVPGSTPGLGNLNSPGGSA